jgi:predicted DNA-binding transcriptional regulator
MIETNGILSNEQVENWRRVLCGILGPYALIMPKEQIQKFRDKMQERVNKLEEEMKEEKRDG